jgi:hypothetical protein
MFKTRKQHKLVIAELITQLQEIQKCYARALHDAQVNTALEQVTPVATASALLIRSVLVQRWSDRALASSLYMLIVTLVCIIACAVAGPAGHNPAA